MNQLKENSVANHLYYHYYRFNGGYQDWDVWAWAYKPDAGEGAKHDWIANGVDEFGGAYVDIDLKKHYDGGWDAAKKKMGGALPYIFLAAMWIAWERHYFDVDISWPWLTLGGAFARSTRTVQWYEYTGMLGGSLWVWVAP